MPEPRSPHRQMQDALNAVADQAKADGLPALAMVLSASAKRITPTIAAQLRRLIR